MKTFNNTIKTNFSHAKVLVIEDNDDQWFIMQRALYQCINEVTPQRVATIEQALAILKEGEYQEWEIPKLILLDLYLPDNIDGLQLLKQIRTLSAPINRIPIVMLTFSTAQADIQEAYQLGISSYMVKPIDFADWLVLFNELRTYWWETVTLPPTQYRL